MSDVAKTKKVKVKPFGMDWSLNSLDTRPYLAKIQSASV